MKTASAAIVLFFAMCLAVLAAGCGGGEEEREADTTPTAQAPATTGTPQAETATPAAPTDRTELEGLLKSMRLSLRDVPSGFTMDEEEFTTNEDAAEDDIDGKDVALARLKDWGRLLGYNATYSSNLSLGDLLTGGTVFIYTSNVIFEKSDGAEHAFNFAEDRLSDPETNPWAKQEGWSDVRLAPMSFPSIGDDTLAYQLSAKAHEPETDFELDFVAQMVAIRRGRGTGLLVTVAVGGASPAEELEAMARKLDERMKKALE